MFSKNIKYTSFSYIVKIFWSPLEMLIVNNVYLCKHNLLIISSCQIQLLKNKYLLPRFENSWIPTFDCRNAKCVLLRKKMDIFAKRKVPSEDQIKEWGNDLNPFLKLYFGCIFPVISIRHSRLPGLWLL